MGKPCDTLHETKEGTQKGPHHISTPALHVSWALMVLKSVNSHWPTVVPFLQGQLMTKPWVHLQENWESPGARDTNAKRVASPADGARAVNEPLPGSLRVGSFELSLWRRSVGPDAPYVSYVPLSAPWLSEAVLITAQEWSVFPTPLWGGGNRVGCFRCSVHSSAFS